MKKRVMAALMAATIVFGAVPPMAYAVTGADPLIASALYSFLLSAGMKLWRDGGVAGAEDMVEDLQTVYDEYLSYDTNADDWASMGQGVAVSEGKIVLTKDSAQTMQGFTNWLTLHYAGAPGKKVTLIQAGQGTPTDLGAFTLPQEELNALTGYGTQWTSPVYTSPSPLEMTMENKDGSFRQAVLSQVKSNTNPVYLIISETSTYLYARFVSLGPFELEQFRKETQNGDYILTQSVSSLTGTVNGALGIQRPNDGSGFAYQYYVVPRQKNSWDITSLANVNVLSSDTRQDMLSYVVLAGDVQQEVVQPEVSAVFGPTVSDLASGLEGTKGLAIDIGAGANAQEEDIVGTILRDYVVPDGATDIQAVATPIPIEGVEELYPQPAVTDIESLGLPDLGAALTSRFPFCIPWDFVNVYKSLNATAQCPVIDVDLFPAAFKAKVGVQGNTSFTIDFGDPKYSTFITLIHWGSLVGFVLALAFATKRLIWTTGG